MNIIIAFLSGQMILILFIYIKSVAINA